MILAVMVLAGCGVGEEASEPVDALADGYGWLSEVALEPSSFAAVTEGPGRDGWIALHAHRYLAAVAALDRPEQRARAEWQLAVLHDDLSRLMGLVYDQLFREWSDRSGLPEGSAAPVVAALAARCTGLGDPARWVGAEVVSLDGELPDGHPWHARAALHRAAAEDPGGLLDTAPVIVEPAEGFERRFYDPCTHATLSRVWSARAASDLGGDDWRAAAAWAGDDVAGRLFAPWLTAEALRADLSKVDRPGLVGLTTAPLTLPELTGDEVQPARDLVQQLDAELGGWSERLLEAAGPDGDALLTDLGLVDRYRQELLIVRAREALLEDRPHQALAILQLARDAAAREVGPRNAPALFALLAEAELRTGRVREALDALQLLAAVHPEVAPLQEVTGDLAVLRGLDRRGDSREE